MNNIIHVGLLDSDDLEAHEKIADWYFSEWSTPRNKTIERLRNQPDDNTLVQAVVRIKNEIVSTGGLSNMVNIYAVYPELMKFKPWISLLYTAKEFRKNGYGQLLLNFLESKAKEMDFNQIYLYTNTAESLYLKNGWNVIQRLSYKDQDTAVMKKQLAKMI